MRPELRPEAPGADEPFLRKLILATIAAELGADAWPEPIRTQILEMQYGVRRQGVRSAHPEGESRLILDAGEPVGWIYTATSPDQVWLAEIMVLPERRGRGLGAAAIRKILADARVAGKPVRLMVNMQNAGAIRLYERLGFRRTGGTEVQHLMEHPGGPSC
jgi:ribosomal protein S18 acetylase RimI-like enzyme